jgi:hypothetical protein
MNAGNRPSVVGAAGKIDARQSRWGSGHFWFGGFAQSLLPIAIAFHPVAFSI